MRKLLYNMRSDESLMLAYQQGDSVAFEVLYGRHKNALFAFLYRSSGNAAVCEELAQEAWMSIIRALERYQTSAKFKTYLYQVAHNKLVDFWRSNNKRLYDVDIDGHDVSDTCSSLENSHASAEARGRISMALLQLPSDQRDAILLREEGFSQEQIAEIVGVGRETVKSRLRYASQQLRVLLAEETLTTIGVGQ